MKLATFILVILSILKPIPIKNKDPMVDDKAIISLLSTGARNEANRVNKPWYTITESAEKATPMPEPIAKVMAETMSKIPLVI